MEHALTDRDFFGQMAHLSFNERLTAREDIAVEDDEGLPDNAAWHLTARAFSTASQRDELPHATTKGGFLADLCNIDPMWKVLNKEVDLGEPTSFLDHVYLGCTQRQCQVSKEIVDNYRTMFESRISAERAEKLPFSQNLRISSLSHDMVGHAKKCVERYCELANKTTQQLYKVSTPCIDDHHFKEEETKSVGELSNTCSQMVLKC